MRRNLKVQLDTSKLKMGANISKLIEFNPENIENISDYTDCTMHDRKEICPEIENTSKILDKVYDTLSTKFIDDSDNWIDTIKIICSEYYEFLDNLSEQQLGALSNLLAAVFILYCLFSVIVIIYSDILLNYLNLENKFPRLGAFIRLRKKLQSFYLFINLLLIIITLLAVIFVNYIALISLS